MTCYFMVKKKSGLDVERDTCIRIVHTRFYIGVEEDNQSLELE